MPPVPKPGILDIAPYAGGKSSLAGGGRVIKLSSNESPLGPSPAALEAYQAASAKLHRYPDGHAVHLRQAIAEVHGLPIERLICGAGSDELIGLLVHAYAGPGDEVLYSEHGFLMYKIYAQGAGATPVAASERSLRADVDALLARASERTKLVFLANPNNPTGSFLTRADLARLRAGLPEHTLLVLDGAYAEYVTDEDCADGRELVESGENTVMLRTFSKIYGLSSLRIGWGYFPAAIADALNRLRGPFNLSGPAIAAGAAAMRDSAHVARAREHNTRWCGWLAARLRALGLTVHSSAANFLLVDFPDAQAANDHLLSQGIIVRAIASYGLPNALRITVGLQEENEALVAALETFLAG